MYKIFRPIVFSFSDFRKIPFLWDWIKNNGYGLLFTDYFNRQLFHPLPLIPFLSLSRKFHNQKLLYNTFSSPLKKCLFKPSMKKILFVAILKKFHSCISTKANFTVKKYLWMSIKRHKLLFPFPLHKIVENRCNELRHYTTLNRLSLSRRYVNHIEEEKKTL